MESFLKYFSAVVGALFLLALLALVYAGVVWVYQAVWTS